MELIEFLSQLNSRVLEQVARENGWDEDSPEALSRQLEGEIPQMWNHFQPVERIVLVYLLFNLAGEPLSYCLFENFARSQSPYGIYRGLTLLRRKGVVYTLRRLWGEMAFYIPCELQISWRKYIRKAFPVESHSPLLLMGGEEGEGLCDVLFSLLQIHRHQPISLTKKSELPSRIRRVWEDTIPYDPALFASCFPEGRGGKVGWLLDLFEELSLMERVEKKKENLLRVNDDRCRIFFTGYKGQVQHQLYFHVKRELIKQNPFYTVILEAIEDQEEDPFSYIALQENWTKFVKEFSLDSEEKEWSEFGEYVLPFLVTMGFINGCQIGERDWTLKWDMVSPKEIAPTNKFGYVQPTFEVILFPYTPYDVRWGIGEFSRLVEKQGVWTFLLEKEWAAGIQDGNAYERFIYWLSKVQEGTIPENILHQMQKWLDPRQKVEFFRGALFRCPTKQLADRLEGAKFVGIQERLNEKVFLVDESHLPSLEKELKKMAISIQLPDEPEIQEKPPMRAEESAYRVESVFPDMADVMPQLKDLPSLWYKNKQKYHPSTLKMFVEKAKTIGVPVEMETGKKEWNEIYISRFVQEQGMDMVYFIEGKREHRIPLMDIGRIQMKI